MCNTTKKQVVLVVEGTAALRPYWPILSHYLYKLIRPFCDNGSSEADSPNVELALVVFNAHGSCSSWLLHRTDWTNDINCFFKWLSAIEFSADGFRTAAIAEGLAQALMMCRPPNGWQNVGLQRHCILVAASNPDDSRPPDAEKVAKSFPQSCVSLSVVCPMQLPKLRSIFNAGKRNPSVSDPNIQIVKHTHYVGLISENLIEDMSIMVTSLPQTVTSAEKLRIANKIWSSYVKVWEGDLYGVRLGHPTLVTRLQAYLSPSASKSLAKDWPSVIQIDHYSRDNSDSLKRRYAKMAYFVYFRAMNQHELLELLLKDKICPVIKLPSQNLLLTLAGKPDRIIGMLFPVAASQQQEQQKLMVGTGMNRGQVSSPGLTQ